MRADFHWTTFDVTRRLPDGWQQDMETIAADADVRDFPRTPGLSREAAQVEHITRGRVHADQVHRGLRWLYQFYRGYFLGLAASINAEPVVPASR